MYRKNKKFVILVICTIIGSLLLGFLVFKLALTLYNKNHSKDKDQKNKWTLIDNSKEYMCVAVIDILYDQENNEYKVPNPCYSNYIYVTFSNGETYSIKEALFYGKVTANELIKKGIPLSKK